MHLILIQHDRQDDAMDAIVLLMEHGYTAAFPTPGACEPAGLLDMAGQLVAEVSTAIGSGHTAAGHLELAGSHLRYATRELPDCPSCLDHGWHRMAADGDNSRTWIERCDDCQRFEDDYVAAAYASRDTGQPIGFDHPGGNTTRPLLPYLHPNR